MAIATVVGVCSVTYYSLVYLLMDDIIYKFVITDNTLLLFSGLMQSFMGCFLFIHSIYVWRNQDPPSACNGPCVWFLFILFSASLLGISIALPAQLNNSNYLYSALHQEVRGNMSTGVLYFGYKEESCCGINYEPECQIDYPPFTLNGTYNEESLCPENSDACQKPCGPVIWENFIYPYKIVFAAIGIITLALEVLEYLVPNVLRHIFWRQLLEQAADASAAFSGGQRRSLRTSNPLFDARIKHFYEELCGKEIRLYADAVNVDVTRAGIVQNSIDQMMMLDDSQWKKRLKISFADEPGQDYGGPLREWMYLMIRHLLNPDHGLFREVRLGSGLYTINEKSGFIEENHLQFFTFTGKLLAKAIYERIPIPCHLASYLLKTISGEQLTPEDLKVDDSELYSSIFQLKSLSSEELDELDLYFTSDITVFGQLVKQIDLKPFDRSTPVTRENVSEYVRLFCISKMTGEIEEQIGAMLEGFYSIIPKTLVEPFTYAELDLLLCGTETIELGDIKTYAVYQYCNESTDQVQWLWKAFESFSDSERTRFISFVTGSDRVPLGGFSGHDGGRQFTIMLDSGRKHDQLPTAHTCFNRLELAKYESYDMLRQRLLTAVTECEQGFGLK